MSKIEKFRWGIWSLPICHGQEVAPGRFIRVTRVRRDYSGTETIEIECYDLTPKPAFTAIENTEPAVAKIDMGKSIEQAFANLQGQIEEVVDKRLAALGLDGMTSKIQPFATDKDGKELQVGDIVRSAKWLVGYGEVVGFFKDEGTVGVRSGANGTVYRIKAIELERRGTHV